MTPQLIRRTLQLNMERLNKYCGIPRSLKAENVSKGWKERLGWVVTNRLLHIAIIGMYLSEAGSADTMETRTTMNGCALKSLTSRNDNRA